MKYFIRLLFSLVVCAAQGTASAQVFRHFSDEEGAPIAPVRSITQDKEGFMWFSSTKGLYRYDSRTFKRYKHNSKDFRSIASNQIREIYEDSKGRLWVLNGTVLSLYNREKDSFVTFRHNPKDPNSLPERSLGEGFAEDSENNLWLATIFGLNKIVSQGDSIKVERFLVDAHSRVHCIIADPNGGLWVGTSNGLLRFKAGRVKRVKQKFASNDSTSYDIHSAHLDGKGTLWLGTTRGLVKLDTTTQEYHPVASVQRNGSLPTIYGIVEDHDKKLWLASDPGLAFFDPETSQVKWHLRDKTNPNALVDEVVTAVYIDQERELWIGGYIQGISYLNTNLLDFSLATVSSENLPSGSYLIEAMGRTPAGKFWTISGKYDRIWITSPGNSSSSSIKLPRGYKFYDAFLDDANILWFHDGKMSLFGYDLKAGKLLIYPLTKIRNGSITGDTQIHMIHKDSRGRIWISGELLGLIRFSPQNEQFDQVYPYEILSTMEDAKGNLWFGGVSNIILLKSNSSIVSILKVNGLDTKQRLRVGKIVEDASGRIWAASEAGLLSFDKKNHHFSVCTSDAPELLGYLDDMQADSGGYLWLGVENKLISYHPDKRIVKVYDHRDGLPYMGQVSKGMSTKDGNGNLYFSTSEGTFRFNPDKITSNNRATMPLSLTSLKLFNKEVNVDDQTALLDSTIEVTKEITFRHDQNIFTLDFALLSYNRSITNRYAYRLENFENDWNYVQLPSATYTNLSPGTYTFLAKAANEDGYWNPKPLRLKITILPPWWKTWYAYLCYILLIAGPVYAITHFFWLRSSFRRENALNQVKLDFFTNVSHEIRTHLSLISGPLEKVYEQFKEGKNIENNLNYARSNSDRLMLLVNELLDFRKIQSGNVRLRVSEHDVVKIIKSVIAAFEHTSKEKDIQTLLIFPDTPVMLWLDVAQMQKVFYNLVSNAYKFTPEGGKVTVRIVEISNEVTITVEDNGRGISEEHLRKLFTYYYQADSEKPGYGIGLALSKSIVEHHHGYLTAESSLATDLLPGGTTLTIRMLRENRHFSPDQIASKDSGYIGNTLTEPMVMPVNGGITHSGRSNTILIIEDNDQLRVFIKELFQEEFNTLEAENGLRGLELANEHLPDIILSDVMMPGMNGLEVCRRLKDSITTSHIPVVLLTARTQNEQIIEGLAVGADDYLGKPFDPRILQLKIINLIRLREELKERYRQSVLADQQTRGKIVLDMNEAFIANLRAVVTENISDSGFGVNELAVQVGMSVSALYRKLKSLTGMTVNEFVKAIRFNEAKRLLESGVYNVSEVVTIIGMEDGGHFTKEFKKFFCKNPNDIKRKISD